MRVIPKSTVQLRRSGMKPEKKRLGPLLAKAA
jgi:hypothetical protein